MSGRSLARISPGLVPGLLTSCLGSFRAARTSEVVPVCLERHLFCRCCQLPSQPALGYLLFKGGQVGEAVSQALACSEPPMMASRVSLSTSCLLSIRRSSKDSRPWRRRSREEPWPSWPFFSTTGCMWPMSVSCLPVPGPGGGGESPEDPGTLWAASLLPRHRRPAARVS